MINDTNMPKQKEQLIEIIHKLNKHNKTTLQQEKILSLLYKINIKSANKNSLDLNYENVVTSVKNLKEDDICIKFIMNDVKEYYENIKAKYINKESISDWSLYEYNDKYTLYLKNFTIDIIYIMKLKLKNIQVSSLYINDKLIDINGRDIQQIIKNTKIKKKVILHFKK